MIKEMAYAKINLALDVVKKRDDGYHELQMIMIPIELHDILTFKQSDKISLSSNIEIENNSILKTVELMKSKFNLNKGVQITLHKNIPIGAGLGGGSADIAATLRGLNKLWSLNQSLDELAEIALELGSDTKFCIYNKPAYVYGRGENLLFLNPTQINNIYLFPSNIQASTKNVFKNHQLRYKKRKFERLMRAYLNENHEKLKRLSYNALLKTTLKTYPELKYKYKMLNKNISNVKMTGSGSTFYILSFNENNKTIDEKIVKLGIDNIKTKPKN